MATEITLSNQASNILKNVLDAMQEADELGGLENHEDYANLMQAIATEALKRKRAALENATAE